MGGGSLIKMSTFLLIYKMINTFWPMVVSDEIVVVQILPVSMKWKKKKKS